MNLIIFVYLFLLLTSNQLIKCQTTTEKKDFLIQVIKLYPRSTRLIHNLNEPPLFSLPGNKYKQGWIMPSNVPITLNLMLYFSDRSNKLRDVVNNFYPLLKEVHPTTELEQEEEDDENKEDKIHHHHSNETRTQDNNLMNLLQYSRLLIYFTNELNCHNYLIYSTKTVQIIKQVTHNVFIGQISNVVFTYSDQPFYICLELSLDIVEQQTPNQTISAEPPKTIQLFDKEFAHQGTDYIVSVITTKDYMPFSMRVIVYSILVLFAGMFSGLNLGLMSLDVKELKILQRIGTPNEKRYATYILPLRKRGNFLLCTIVLGNSLVNAVSTLILGDMVSGLYAALGSTILIVLFGEILPQSVCNRHGLAIGAAFRYVMYFFMFVTFPISYPMSLILDMILKADTKLKYDPDRFKEILTYIKDLADVELKVLRGEIDFFKKKVSEIQTPLRNVYALELNTLLTFDVMHQISSMGHSRIPVYETTKENIVGILNVKDFILLDPKDELSVNALLNCFKHKVLYIDSDMAVNELFDVFCQGDTHMAFITDVVNNQKVDPYVACTGIVTMEDVIESLVEMEILDEFDVREQQQQKKLQMQQQLSSRSESNNEYSLVATVDETSSSNNPSPNHLQSHHHHHHHKKHHRKRHHSHSNHHHHKPSIHPSKSDRCLKSYLEKKDFDISFFLYKELLDLQKHQHHPHSHHHHNHKEGTSGTDNTLTTTTSRSDSLIPKQIRHELFIWSAAFKPFTDKFLTENVLNQVLERTLREYNSATANNPNEQCYLYKYGKVCNYFILILAGEATMEVGHEKLEFPVGPFTHFGLNALCSEHETYEDVLKATGPKEPYIPDFSLRVDNYCCYMRLDRMLWRDAVLKSHSEMKHKERKRRHKEKMAAKQQSKCLNGFDPEDEEWEFLKTDAEEYEDIDSMTSSEIRMNLKRKSSIF